MGVATAEDGTGHHQHTTFKSFFRELGSGQTKCLGDRDERVERSTGNDHIGEWSEFLDHEITSRLILIDVRSHRDVVAGLECGLGHRWGTDIGELLEFRHLIDQPRRSGSIPEAPAGAAIGLAESANQQDLIPESGS